MMNVGLCSIHDNWQNLPELSKKKCGDATNLSLDAADIFHSVF